MKFEELKGLSLASVENKDNVEVIFTTVDGRQFRLFHDQGCCESVGLEDIAGDLSDLVGEVLLAEESTSDKNPEGYIPDGWQDSFLWTFYRIGTVLGTVVLRWYGESNGYYSESVDFEEIER